MDTDLDSLDDSLLAAATTDRTLGKFRPKSRPKAVKKPVSAPSKLPDAAQVIPLIMEPPPYVADPKCSVEKSSPPTSYNGSSMLNASNLGTTHDSVCEPEVSCSEPLVSSGENEAVSLFDQGESEAIAFSSGLEPLDDGLFQSNATSGTMVTDIDSLDDSLLAAATTDRTQGKFRPKSRPKAVKKPVSAPSKLPDAAHVIPPIIEPPPCVADPKCPNEKSSLPTSYNGSSMLNASNLGTTHDSVCELEVSCLEPLVSSGKNEAASLFDQGESVAMAFSSGLEPLDDGLFETIATSGTMGTDIDSLDDSLIVAATTDRTLGKFRPKSRPKVVKKPLSAPSNLPNAAQDIPSIMEAPPIVADPKCPDEKSSLSTFYNGSSMLNASNLGITHDSVCEPEVSCSEPLVSSGKDEVASLFDEGESEAMAFSSGLELLDDGLFQTNTTSVKVGKFQPKLAASLKVRENKRVTFSIPDAAETAVRPMDSHSSPAQDDQFDMLVSNSTEMEPSSIQMLGEASLNDAPHSSFRISDCNGNREEDPSEIQGLESLQNIPSKPTSTIGKFQPKLSAKAKIKSRSTVTRHSVPESLHPQRDPLPMEAEPFEGQALFSQPDSIIDSIASSKDNHIVGRETTVPVSDDISKELPTEDAELTQQRLDERSTPDAVENKGARKSSRISRKRIDRTHDDGDFDNLDISQTEEAHSDDEDKGEGMPKQKRVPRKSKRQMTENKTSTRKQKKASEEPSSTEQEPKKKNFPHATKRRRRQVNKELLETPQDEIDPKQLRIKDLLMLADAKERISNKEAAVFGKSSSNQSSSFPNNTNFDAEDHFESAEEHLNHDGDGENYNIQPSSRKLNYHSFMKRPSNKRWSKSETELLYQAIRQFGTDFAMIQKLLPGRTRHQVKLKFKNEERKFPMQVADALMHRSKDHSHFKLVIQKLEEEEKEKEKEYTTYDPYAMAQDMAAGNEEEEMQPEKEEQEVNGWDGEADMNWDGEADMNWNGEAQSPGKFDEYEGGYEWDGNAYYPPEDEGKSVYDD